MGVRRIFSKGGQNFQGGRGGKTYYLPKKHPKNTAKGVGKSLLLPSSADAYCYELFKDQSISIVILGIGDSLPRLSARTGTGYQALPTETPSKRTKKTDEAKLLRTVRMLKLLLFKSNI